MNCGSTVAERVNSISRGGTHGIRTPTRVCKASCPERQYPVEANLEYKTSRGDGVLKTGHGMTVSMSSSRIVFKPEYPIPVGLRIEAYVDWPVRLNSVIALRLHVHGETIETEKGYAAVTILRHEFRIAPKSHASSAIRAAGAV